MKNLNLFTICLISFLSICPIQLVNSCAGGEWDVDEDYLKPFDQELIEFPDYYPFLYSEHYWNDYNDWFYYGDDGRSNVFNGQGANLNDWKNYFNDKFSLDEIEDVIYNSETNDIIALNNYLNGKSDFMKENWKDNPLVKYWKENKSDPAIKYLMLAKEIEPYVEEVGWWDTPQRDTVAMTQLKQDALNGLFKSKNPFIQLRYLYQAMRMAHYTGNYEECINLYDRHIDAIQSNSVIKYWCLSLKAGAYWRLSRFAESSYFNSIVFDQCPSRRLCAERDFWIDNETTWQKCLSMCKDDHERNILWLLTGINQNNSALPALNEMLKIDPSSAEIELLLAREIEKMQRNYMPAAWISDVDDENNYGYLPPANDKDELFAFIKKGLDTKRVRTQSFWFSAAALIQLINQNYGDCDQYCEFAEASANGNTAFIEQAKVIRILNRVEEYGKINAAIEAELFDDIKWLKAGKSSIAMDTYKLVMYRLMKYFQANNDALDAEMCRATVVEYYDIYINPTEAPLDALYTFFTDENKRPFQDFLAMNYPYNADDILEIKGTLYMREYNWADAVAVFSKMKSTDTYLMKLPTDPFLIHIWDCHDCDFAENPADYTKYTFALKMLELENQIKKNPENKAELFHLLGNAYYNITHFGNSWMAIDYYLSSWYWEWSDPDGEDREEFMDCSMASEYYQKAVDASNDPEFQAMNIFMLAKCEQNLYYQSDDYEFENASGRKELYRSNFSTLLNKYNKTYFYQQAISECKYFDYYVSTH